jgi:hypothetical protein
MKSKKNPLIAGLLVALIGPFAFGYIRSALVATFAFISFTFYSIAMLVSIGQISGLNNESVHLFYKIGSVTYFLSIIFAVVYVIKHNAHIDSSKKYIPL